jgi:hypothetical protein
MTITPPTMVHYADYQKAMAKIASLRAELDLEKGLRSTLLANWQADTERKETAARQDAEEKARLLEALKPFAELGAKASGNGKYALVEVAHCQSAALACRPQGEKS